MDAYSAMVDWKFAAKFDTYAGFMVSQVNGLWTAIRTCV
jgi:hypothetical protein